MTLTKTINSVSRKSLPVLCLAVFAAWSNLAQATEFEIARLATEIYSYSTNLAHQVRYARGYGNVKMKADRLSREAAQLVDVIQRGRSVSYVRSQFKEVSRRYEDLENAFLRANRSSPDQQLYNSVSLISSLYSALSNQVYYTDSLYRSPDLYYYNAPVITGHRVPYDSVQRGRIDPNSGFGSQSQANKKSRLDYGTISARRQ